MAIEKNETTLILGIAVIAVAYFGLIKPVTNKLGLTQSQKDKAEAAAVENAENIVGWDPNFYKSLPNNRFPKVVLMKDAIATARAKQIKKAWGALNDDEQAIYAVFRLLRSQAQLSQLVHKYNLLYKQDLLKRLQTPWYYLEDGLDESEFVIIANMVNKLPVNVIA
jgi:hypothetical protein